MRSRLFLVVAAHGFNGKMPAMNFGALGRYPLLILVAILLSCKVCVSAQSGRRSNGGTTTTAPSVSGPKAVEKKPDKPASLQLLVGIEEADAFVNIPFYLSDTVLDNCIRRLSDPSDVLATSAGRGLTKSEALRRAKDEKNRYVVWLQIGSDVSPSTKQSKNGPDELYVSYIVFEPETAKIRVSGRAHHSIYKAGQVGVSGPMKNSPIYSEYAMKEVAREIADRILDAFDIKVRDDHPLQNREP
jgi:hypothetical protein